jgi:glycolate oxidase iron-sulfur subunit
MAPRLNDEFFDAPPSELVPATSPRRFTVGMVSGCIMPLAFAPTNDATVRVLAANGCDVVIPKTQRCCGALAAHAGDEHAAASMARANIDAFEAHGIDRIDAIIINSAGCGAQLKAYDHVLRHDPAYAARARRFVGKVEDVAEFLARVGLTAPLGPVERTVTYQDACHLVHGQGIRTQPRELLQQVPGLKLIEMRDASRCCGSAGIYNILQPETSAKVLEAKLENVCATGANCVVASNPGCLLQINMGLRDRGLDLDGKHLVDILDEAVSAGQRASVRPSHGYLTGINESVTNNH